MGIFDYAKVSKQVTCIRRLALILALIVATTSTNWYINESKQCWAVIIT